jgi:hypothetical protein
MATVLRFIDETKVVVGENYSEVRKAVKQAAVPDTDFAKMWPFVDFHIKDENGDVFQRCVNMGLVKDFYPAGKYI